MALNVNRTYQSEAEIIFLPKNVYVTNSMDAVLSNVKHVVSSAFFYRKLVEENQDIEDPADQLPEYKRKEYWNNTVTVERLENSFVLRIRVTHDDREQAELLASFIVKDIMLVMSKYYDIRNDLETRVIESVFTRSVSTVWIWEWFLGSVAGGFSLAIVTTWILAKRRSENTLRPYVQTVKSWYLPSEQEINNSVKKEVLRKEDTQPAEKVLYSGKKASAPENLPVGSEFVINKEVSLTEEKKPEKIIDHEATPEEVKERLNKLLRGEM